MDVSAAIFSPHPLLAAAGRAYLPWTPGGSLAEILAQWQIPAHVDLAVAVDGVRHAPETWATVIPHPGQVITVRTLLGKDGGSNPIAAVLSIALSFVAPWMAAYAGLAGGGFMATAAGQLALRVGITLVGNAVINSVFKPHTPDAMTRSDGAGSAASPTYALNGSNNRLRPFEPLPLVYGRHRLSPDLASKPYTVYIGNEQYLYSIFNCGISNLALSDWRIGDTPLANYTDVLMQESNPDGRVPSFAEDVETLAGGALAPGVYLTRSLSANTNSLQVDVVGSLYAIDEETGAQLWESCEFVMQYREVGSPTWLPMTTGTATAYYTNYWSAGRYDGPDWLQIAFGSTRADEYAGGASYAPPQGSVYYNDGNSYVWRWRPYTEITDGGTLAPASAYLVATTSATVQNSTRDAVRITFNKGNLDPAKSYEVTLARVTPAATKTSVQIDFSCTAIRCLQVVNYANTQLAGQRRLGVRIKATGQLNGLLDELTCIADARVRVGTSPADAYAASSNPAWIFLDFVRGRRNANGQRMYGVCLADARIDMTALAAWATFCTTSNLEFNGVFDQRQSCAEVLQTIARCGRGSVTWNTGKLGVVWDAANQPVTAVFGMANIVAGSFKVQYVTGNMADEIVVNFINRARNWQRDTLRKAKPGVTTPVNPVELEIFGCTSEDQAGREAALLAAGQYYRRRMMTWESDVEGLVVTRGDVVMLSHDLTQWGYSGRVVSFPSAGSVTLNKTVPVAGGEYLLLRHPNGTMTTLVITNTPGDTDTLTGALPSTTGTAAIDWVWMYGPTATPGKKVKITSIEPLDELHVRIVAVDEEAGYYAAESDPWSYTPPDSLSLLAPRVTRLAFVESIALASTWVPQVQIDWSTENSAGALVVIKRNGYVIYNQTVRDDISHLEYLAAVGDVFVAEIAPVSMTGIRGTLATASLTLTGGTINAAPADVTRVNAVYEGKNVWLTWEPVSDYRGISYEVRWGESWGAGVAYPAGGSLRFKTLGDGDYWVKAKTGNGIYSVNAKGIRVENAAFVENVIATLDESGTGWGGSFDRTYENAQGAVSLVGVGLFSAIDPLSSVASLMTFGGFDSEGYYRIPAAHVVDIGTPGACSVTTALAFDVHDPNYLIGSVPVFSALPSIKCPAGGSGSVDVEMNIAQADGVYSGWQPFKPGTYWARLFDYRLRLTSDNAAVSPFVTAWQIAVDVPDRIDSAEVITPAGTLAVSFTRPFNTVPKIQITILNATAGDDAVLTGITSAGFSLTIKNAGASVVRTVHYLAQGY